MSLKSNVLPQESTAQLLAESLRQAILEGQLKPGSRLVEQDLAEQYEISRGPIREAIRILAAEGLAELRKNKGAVVSTPNMDDVLEVYAIRMSLGAIAIDQLARTALESEVDLEQAQKLLANMNDRKVRQSNTRMIEADLLFQNGLVSLSGLPRITEAMEKSAVDIRVCVQALDIKYDESDHENLVNRHTKLLSQIAKANSEKAVELWVDHIRKSVAEFTKGMSSDDLNELFDRPLMRHVFESKNGKAK
jgi:DNA-binding GntR family transcriptional regulator